MSSLLSQLMNKSAVSAAIKKESSNDAKAAAPAQESGKGEGSISEKNLGAPESAPAKANSVLGALAAKSNPNGASPAPALAAIQRMGEAASAEKAAARESLQDGSTKVGGGVPAKPSLLTALASTRDIAEKAKADHDYLFAPIPENFQDVLDTFDGLMKRDQGEIDFNLGHIRNYVQRIMTDLRTNPEYDGLIIDRDVHNIMAFLQRTKAQAEISIGSKVEKAAKKAAKQTGAKKFAMDFSSLDLGAEQQPKSLADLSDLGEL